MSELTNAAGFILACMHDGTRLYLLLRNATHGDWGLPKGHAEPGESATATARRETLEETGIDAVRIVPEFERVLAYDVNTPERGSYRKQVTYFLGLVDKPSHLQSDEHSDSGWFTLEEALGLLPHGDLRQLLREADARLSNTKESSDPC